MDGAVFLLERGEMAIMCVEEVSAEAVCADFSISHRAKFPSLESP